jgi:Uma2 family endonuclease
MSKTLTMIGPADHGRRMSLEQFDKAEGQGGHSGSECKLLIDGLESERHPDLAIYKRPPPKGDNDDEVWSQWVPEIVVEVVSPSSRYRDYEEKPAEYLRLGVREYWIVDVDEGVLKVLRRSRGRWAQRTIRPPEIYRTSLLRGLQFSIETVFQAALEA